MKSELDALNELLKERPDFQSLSTEEQEQVIEKFISKSLPHGDKETTSGCGCGSWVIGGIVFCIFCGIVKNLVIPSLARSNCESPARSQTPSRCGEVPRRGEVSSQGRFFSKELAAEKRFANWTRIDTGSGFEFKIPPTMEVRDGQYQKQAAVFKYDVEKATKMPLKRCEVCVQQKGLGVMDAEALKYYMRLMYTCEKGKPGDNWNQSEVINLRETDAVALDRTFRKEVEDGFLKAREIGVNQRILRWDKIQAVQIAGMSAIKLSYLRQLGTNAPVEFVQYQIGDDDRMHYLSFSYRECERDRWFSDWVRIQETFKLVKRND